MGEPLAMLPPKVPALRTGGEAKRSHISRKGGTACASAPQADSSVAAAPIHRPGWPSKASARICVSSATAPM